jgi:hypothetical protein
MTQSLAPVVIFAFNRPQHLRRTLDALAASRLANRSVVHVFADGPRKNSEPAAILAVQRVLEQEAHSGRFGAFHGHVSDVNMGLANSIIGGVTEVIAECDRVIVLEDDLLVSVDFLEFMNDCLDFYSSDLSVGAVSGFCPIRLASSIVTGSIFAVGRSSSNAWGTWSRVWRDVDWSAKAASELDESFKQRLAFNQEGNDRYDRLRRQLAGRIDSWSIRFGLSLFRRQLLTVYPVDNRVHNIGYDNSGVHSRQGDAMNDEIKAAPYKLGTVSLSRAMQAAFYRAYSGPILTRFSRNLLFCSPRISGWLGR